MEVSKKQLKIFYISLTAVFISVWFYIQVWMLKFTDYPYQDEYHSILRALGKNTYPSNLHVKFLSLFAEISKNFYDVFTLNFILSGFFLTVIFFFYHQKKGISLPTNIFFTSMLALCSLHIALSRKMHFWAAGFYFLILLSADFFSGKKREFYLLICFSILAFFRMEFAFAAAWALASLVGVPKTKKQALFFAMALLIGSALAIGIIYEYVGGMKDLVAITFGTNNHAQNFNLFDRAMNALSIFFANVYDYGRFSIFTFLVTFKHFFFTLLNAFVLLFFFQRPLRENLRGLWQEIKKNQIYYLAAMIPLLALRNIDSYIIMFYVLMLSLMSFLLNTRPSRVGVLAIFLVLPAFFVGLPDYSRNFEVNFPSIRGYNGLVNRPFHDFVQSLPKKSYEERYYILSYERMTEVLGHEGVEFFLYPHLEEACKERTIPFDVVLIQDSWRYDPNRKGIEKCVVPAMSSMREFPFTRGFLLYLSPRAEESYRAYKMHH